MIHQDENKIFLESDGDSRKFEDIKDLIETAKGSKEADLVLKNGKIVNVFTNQILLGDIAVCKDKIAGIGSYKGKKEIDLQQKFVVPGLIEAHFHVESSMTTPSRLSALLLEHGICTVIADPHEIVNASGKAGLDYMLAEAKESMLDYYFMIPSSVPSCDFEINGAGDFDAGQMKEYTSQNNVLGLAEVMRMQDILHADKKMLEKILLFSKKNIDGHAPGLKGKDLQAYKAAGILNDHEAADYEEALERLQLGFHLFIREGSGAKNLKDILPGLLENNIPLDHCSFCTDDKHIEDIFEEGTIDYAVRKAIALKTPSIEAVKMATINTARHYHLDHRGAVAPGYKADLVILNDLDTFSINKVIKNGQELDFSAMKMQSPVPVPSKLCKSVHLPNIEAEDLQLTRGKQFVIQLVPDQLYTRKVQADLSEENYPSSKYNLLVAAERYGKTGEFACCALQGFNLKNGAVAMSYAHDSHNVLAVGDSKEDIILALKTLQDIQGGLVLVEKGKVYEALSMEAAGMMSIQPAETTASQVKHMKDKTREMGVPEGIDPFANLSFLSLPVIPEIRLTPQGLYDVFEQKFLTKSRKVQK